MTEKEYKDKEQLMLSRIGAAGKKLQVLLESPVPLCGAGELMKGDLEREIESVRGRLRVLRENHRYAGGHS